MLPRPDNKRQVKNKKKSLLSNWIVRNLLLAVVLIAGLALGAEILLGVVTRHNSCLSVPDFTGMSVEEASRIARGTDLRLLVTDSINVRSVPGGQIVRQNPEPGSKVKSGRRIRLTINAKERKKVPAPNIVGLSLRSASAELSARGLKIAELTYVRDIATNNVLRQTYRGRDVVPGQMLPSEAGITLVLGLNNEENMTRIPNLTGLRWSQAVERIHDCSLNVGEVSFDRTVRSYKDSTDAVVCRQYPENAGESSMMGYPVSIWLTKSENTLPQQ